MQIRASNLRPHASTIGNVLATVCEVSSHITILLDELVITLRDAPDYTRRATNDLGESESVLRLPIPSADSPNWWIGLHENWRPVGRRDVRFGQCGIRVYSGTEQGGIAQVLRLEWVAPQFEKGAALYTGGHAGHPHWHVDQSVIFGEHDLLRTMELLTASDTDASNNPPEVFTPDAAIQARTHLFDCSWLPRMHLPASARWMDKKWDGIAVPGPHQCEPESLTGLEYWWEGALRYLVSELQSRSA